MKKLIVFCIFVLLGSCSSYDKELGNPLDFMYAQAINGLNNNDLATAEEYFNKIINEYPYKDEAIEAQVFLIWINYFNNDYADAEINIESFLKYYVYNDYVPWVKYMEAVVQYEQIPSNKRDLGRAYKSLQLFDSIIKQNKNSKYAKDAELKIQAIKYKLAYRIMVVGRYYLDNKNYFAALSNYNEIIKMYNDTLFIDEALYYNVYIWLVLGVDEEAFKAASVLGYNHPDSKWYKDSLKLIKKYTKYDFNTKINKVS